MNENLIFLIAFLFLTFCKPTAKPDVEQLFEADRKFSATAVEKGYPEAFAEFAHPDGVILRPNSMPIVGKAVISELYRKADTTGVHFTWEPLAGDIAASGELGYTYGIYSFTKDSVTKKGSYVSIWKKDAAGNWKYTLDCGNEGLGEKLNNSK